jgi:hypothetical protein
MSHSDADFHLDLGSEVMMEGFEKNAKNLFLLLILIMIGAAFQVNSLRMETHKLLAREIPRNLGMGDTLKSMVETLEADLAARGFYEPMVQRDPLALRRVVRMPVKENAGEEKSGSPMRLSATLLAPGHFTAIVKYQGRSHTLAVGDSLDHHIVQSIDKRTVVLEHQGRTLVLVNEPASKAEVQAEGSNRDSRRGRLEDLEL